MNESFSIALVLASSRPSGTDFEYPSLQKIGARAVSALIPLLEPKIEANSAARSGAVLGALRLAHVLARTAGPRNPFAYGTASELEWRRGALS